MKQNLLSSLNWYTGPWHALFLVAGGAFGAWRYESLQTAHLPPVPAREPRTFTAIQSRPDLIDDVRLNHVLLRLQPDFGTAKPSINHVDHALRFWGTKAEFPSANALSGSALRELLLDHRAFVDAWGTETKPLLVPSTGGEGLQFRTRSGPATSSHVDHTLAGLAEVGTPLDYPVLTPLGERPLAAAFQQMFQEFSLNQEEYEWSTLVFLHYLSDVPAWTTTEGQRITWDRLAERLMRQRLNQGVCYGQHRLYVLAVLLQRDAELSLLTPPCREQVEAHLRDATKRLVATQQTEGYWTGDWPGPEAEGETLSPAGPLGPKADRLLATGHVLEWWLYAPTNALPEEGVIQRASDWLMGELEQLSDAEVRRFYPFLTHAGRALALWNGVEPAVAIRTTPASVEAVSIPTVNPVGDNPPSQR